MLKKFTNTLTITILAIMTLVALALLGPSLLGYKPYAVLSGSMEPNLHVGSMAYVQPTTPENINQGDVITYTMSGNSSKLVTHRVVSIDNLEKKFLTKGDANTTVDGPVEFNRLVGKIIFSIPYLGFGTVYIKTKQGLVMLAAIIILMIALNIIIDLRNKKNQR